ncbi:MAG: OmpL47-type beta-barrel domain-containing protein [Candidatus Limnocylindria bacterium]
MPTTAAAARQKTTRTVMVLFTLAVFVSTIMSPLGALATDPTPDTSASDAPAYAPSGPPTIQSDLEDYPPGGFVTLTGTNWYAGESVHIFVNDDWGSSWNRHVDVTADDAGNIIDQFNLPNWFVAEYSVVATGELSGVANTTFTDSNPQAVNVGAPTSVTVIQEATAAYGAVTVVKGGNNSPCDITLSATDGGGTGLPTGVSAVFGANPLTMTTGDVSTSLSVSTTASTPTGTYTFTVFAGSSGDGCQGPGAGESAFLTLIVTAAGDAIAPAGSVSINDDDALTNSTAAMLHLQATDATGVTDYRVANGSDCSSATWISVASTTALDSTVAHTLTSGDGEKTVCAQFRDAALNVSSTVLDTITFDATQPTVTLTSALPNPTNTSPIPVTAQFSETVTGFDASDISATNATVGSFLAVDGDTYTFALTPAAQGTVTADVAAGVASDAAGNGNSAAAQFSRLFDSIAPAVQITLDPASPDGSNSWYISNVEVSVGTTDAGSGVNASTVQYSLDGGATWLPYSAPFDLTTDGSHTVDARATDNAGNTASDTQQVSIDKTAPHSIVGTPDRAANAAGWYNAPVDITFNGTDDLSGIDTCSSATYSGPDSATALQAGSCTDLAGNTGNGSFGLKYDETDPTVGITSPMVGLSTIALSIVVAGDVSDDLSGVASVKVGGYLATVASDTFVVSVPLNCGLNTLYALATDVADNQNSDSVTITRICFNNLQYYSPLDQTTPSSPKPVVNTGKMGRVIPTKVTFKLEDGTVVTEALAQALGWTIQIGVNGATCENGIATDAVESYADAGQSSAGTELFRWTPTQWTYNLDTGKPPQVAMSIGSCYRLDVYVNDGVNKIKASTGTYALFKPTK